MFACAQGTQMQPAPGVVAGSITYRERIALPPDAVVEIWIADVSPGMIVAQVLLADTTVRAEGRQVPLPFELRFDPARAEATHTYALKAVIKSADGQELFTSGDSTFVITQGNPSRVDLVLRRGGAGDGGTDGLAGSSWLLEDLAGAGVVDRVQATLDFTEPGRVVGNASCNRYFGTVEITGATIRIGSLGATKMACADAINKQEMQYLKALENAERFTLEGTILQVFMKGEKKPLRFTRRG
jgi:putative lipoprotein